MLELIAAAAALAITYYLPIAAAFVGSSWMVAGADQQSSC